MSSWTYINGAVYVGAAGRTSSETRYILDTVLDHLPLVRGSERNMGIHISPSFCYRQSSSTDEFELWSEQVSWPGDNGMDVREDYILTIEAELRDREFEETVRDFMKWLCRLAKRLSVGDICIKVHDKCGKVLVITDPKPFAEMEETASCLERHGESAWWEYLLWEREPFSGRPLWHAYRYGNDPKVKEEVERRRKWHEEYDRYPPNFRER